MPVRNSALGRRLSVWSLSKAVRRLRPAKGLGATPISYTRSKIRFYPTDFCGRENGTKLANCASDFMAALAKQHTSPLAVRLNPMSPHYADCMAGKEASPAALASNLAYLQIDLTDPDFRRHLVKQARATCVASRWLVQAQRSLQKHVARAANNSSPPLMLEPRPTLFGAVGMDCLRPSVSTSTV